MDGDTHDPHRIATTAQLRELYREPTQLVIDKVRPELDAATQRYLSLARVLFVGSHAADGSVDVSPRGGEAGFVQVLDAHRLAIADLGGNNRIDTLRNVVETGWLGLLAVIPGRPETVRVAGRAHVTTDPDVLARFPLSRVPKTAIVVDVVSTFIHCGKAFLRGEVWEPEVWSQVDPDAPDAADIVVCQGIATVDAATVRAALADGYAAELAAERAPG